MRVGIPQLHSSSKRTSLGRWSLFVIMFSISLSGCHDSSTSPGERIPVLGTARAPLMAYCDAQVIGTGEVDIERDYLPHVINCENGGAGLEALKAQAVAARSYLYYRLNNSGDINDGQSDQVYTCGREPSSQHFTAVEETSGEVLSYQDAVIAAFYVAGAIPSQVSCVGAEGDSDQFNTERYVTYNQGKSGDEVTQTSLGWVNPGNIYNRGCKSQNGAACLANQEFNYREILRFYYGEDITIERAVGECILEAETGGETGEVAGDQSLGGEMGGEMGGTPVAGQEMGGQETGGQETGGQETGGQETGGQETGGQETGGQETGGQETGGQETGGQETGGQETGGQQTGGSMLAGVLGSMNGGSSDLLGGEMSGAPQMNAGETSAQCSSRDMRRGGPLPMLTFLWVSLSLLRVRNRWRSA